MSTYRERLGYPPYTAKKIDCTKMEVVDLKTGVIKLVPSPQLVEKSHAEDLDINKIIKRFTPQELQAQAARVDALYGDFATFEGLQAAYIRMDEAKAEFMNLPAEIRREFNNNPGLLVQAIDRVQAGDTQTRDKLENLGLLQKWREPTPPSQKELTSTVGVTLPPPPPKP